MIRNYKNGNYMVFLDTKTGTKIRINDKDSLIPNRPESIDVKITNECNHGCLFCHEGSIPNGKKATYDSLKSFTKTLPPYIEISVGGGNLMLDFKHTQTFLEMLKEVNAIPSITIKQEDFIEYSDIIQDWYINELIYGVGVSLSDSNDERLYENLKYFPTAVIHVIAGIFNKQDFNNLKNKDIKLLILGYKTFRRGRKYFRVYQHKINDGIEWLSENIINFMNHFSVVSFDNLAIKQLDIQNKISKEQWNQFYMGDDGDYTFYVDLVENTYAKSSRSIARFSIEDYNIDIMFHKIKGVKHDSD